MKSFLKYLLATIIGVFISLFIAFLIFLGIIGSIVSSTDKPFQPKPNSVLIIKLNYPIMDRSSQNPMDNFDFSTFRTIKRLGLNDILKNIEKAKDDENIKGIFLDLTVIPAGYATVEEIRESLKKFKESGKFIIAFGELYSQKAYYLASVANRIYLTPAGIIDFSGIAKHVLFYKGTFDKLGIEPQIIRHGEYKSYVEPYILKEMSKANKEQTIEYVGDIWNYALKGISSSRNISLNQLNKIADDLTSIVDLEKAIEYKFIDGLKYRDEVYDEIKDTLLIAKDKKISFVSLSKYDGTPKKRKEKGLIHNKIAIVYAQGDINIGEGDENSIGATRISKALKTAREDTSIKAIVFRVNSPGGTILGSEIIRREVELAAQSKPLIASMGDVAASGGYYILCNADTIIANPNTITGSIGVLGIIYNAKKFMNEKLGLTSDLVKTNDKSDLGSFFRPLTNAEKSLLQKYIEKSYYDFIGYVANGRGMTLDEIDNIGRGRVWSGEDALENGLIDLFGGLEKAVEIAAEISGLETYRIVELPKQEDPFELIIKEIAGEAKTKLLKAELGDNYKYIQEFKKLLQFEGIIARIPFDVELE